MNIENAKKVISKAVSFFDIRSGSKVDFITEGKKVVFIDPLGVKVEAQPTSVGNNNYNLVQETCRLQHQIKFQNGSPQLGVNGLSNEAVIATVLHRLNRQNESFPSAYNTLAILFLQGALTALHTRVKDRTEFGIYDTDQVAPQGEEEAKFAHALAVINSLGILQNVVFKFDHAYGLNIDGNIHGMLEVIGKFLKPAKNENDANILSAFMFSSVSLVNSGFFKTAQSIAGTIFSVKDEEEKVETKNEQNDSPTNQAD